MLDYFLPNEYQIGGYSLVGSNTQDLKKVVVLSGLDFNINRNYILRSSRRPIARLFDGLTDRIEKIGRENRAVGAHNRTIGCDFKESDGVGRTLTCQTRSDGSHPIIHFYHCAKCIMRLIQQKLYPIGRAVGTKNQIGSEQT